MKLNLFFAGITLTAAALCPLKSGAEILPIDEEHFPDAKFREYLLSSNFIGTGQYYDKDVVDVANKTIDTEKVTKFYYLFKLPQWYQGIHDLECLKLFPNLTGVLDLSNFMNKSTAYGTVKIDVSGTKITSITNGIKTTDQTNKFDVRLTSIVADNCKELTSVSVSKCKSLKEFSVRGCSALTSLSMAKNPYLEYLDLSDAVNLESVDINGIEDSNMKAGNCRLKILRLPDKLPKMTHLLVDYCDIEEINLKGIDNDVISATGKAGIISVKDNPRLKNVDIRHLPDLPRMLWSNNALTYLNFANNSAMSFASINRKTVHKRHLGYLPDGVAFDITDGLYENLSSWAKITNVKGGAFSGKYFMFDNGVTTASYTLGVPLSNGNNNNTNTTLTVTLYRDLAPREFYIVGDMTDGEFDEQYKLIPSDDVANTWELNKVMLEGDFVIKEKGGQNLVFGGHPIDRTKVSDTPGTPAAAPLSRAGFNDYDFVQVKNDDELNSYAAYSPKNTELSPSMTFTTHNYHIGETYTIHDTNVTFSYIPANTLYDSANNRHRDELGSLSITGGTITAIDDIMTDREEASDANAPVEYYNLQGIRVANPTAPGIYIRRQGRHAEKIML